MFLISIMRSQKLYKAMGGDFSASFEMGVHTCFSEIVDFIFHEPCPEIRIVPLYLPSAAWLTRESFTVKITPARRKGNGKACFISELNHHHISPKLLASQWVGKGWIAERICEERWQSALRRENKREFVVRFCFKKQWIDMLPGEGTSLELHTRTWENGTSPFLHEGHQLAFLLTEDFLMFALSV